MAATEASGKPVKIVSQFFPRDCHTKIRQNVIHFMVLQKMVKELFKVLLTVLIEFQKCLLEFQKGLLEF